MKTARSSSIRTVTAALVAAAATVALAACGSSDDAAPAATEAGKPDLSKVTLKIGQGSAQAENVFKAAGQDKDLPYKIKWVTFDNGPLVAQSLKSGAVDFGFNVGPAQLSDGDPLRIVVGGTGWEKANALVARKDSGISSLQDLRGKKIGVIEGATDYLTYQLADQGGVSKDDVELVKLSTTTGLAAFKAGRIDAWTIWYPLVSQAVKAGGTVIADGSSVPETGADFVTANVEALDDDAKSAAFADFVRRHSTAQNWVNAHPDEWAPTYAKLWGLDLPAAKDALQYLDLTYAPIDDALIAGQQKLYDYQASQGGKAKTLDLTPFFDHRFDGDVVAP